MAKKDLHTFTEEVVVLAHGYHAKVLVNVSGSDDDLCGSDGADGVHFSSAQLMNLATRPDFNGAPHPVTTLRELIPARQIAGTGFRVLAPVLPTPSHPGVATLGWRKFAALIRECSIPIYALGGLRYEDLPIAWEHGAHGIAVMRAAGS